jgi:hypothetical protein
MAFNVGATTVIDNSRNINNAVNITASGNIGGGIIATQAQAEAGTINTKLMTPLRVKQFIAKQIPPLGASFGGGRLICRSGGTAWVVAPSSSQVSRNWYSRNHANTRAQQVSGCTGWFVPTISQLQNPGFTCRQYWDSYSTAIRYWSSTQAASNTARDLNFANGAVGTVNKVDGRLVRSFRCVTY